MKTTDKIKSYGRLNTATIRACAKNKAFAKAMILAYIDQRANLPWVFCICNIVTETGITEKTVKRYIKELVAEGVLQRVPHSQYKGQMRTNMTYYSLNKAAYEIKYWTIEESQSNNETADGLQIDEVVTDKEGNGYRDKGVTIPEKGGKDSRVEGVISSEKGGKDSQKRGSHSEKGGNDSEKGGTRYLEKGVTATPVYIRVEEDVESDEKERKKDREKESRFSLPASLSSSRFSEVIKASVNPFSQPMFVKDPDRPAPRNDNSSSKVTEQTKSANVTDSSQLGSGSGSGLVNSQRSDQPANQTSSGKVKDNGSSSILTDSKPYNYTIDGQTHEIFFDSQEENAALSAGEKVTVLKRALVPFITIGDVEVPRACVMQVNGKSFELARQFFESNPALPVTSLLKVIWECNRVACENPVKESGFKPCFTHRAASESLTYLLKNLETINGTMPEDLRLPDHTEFLTVW